MDTSTLLQTLTAQTEGLLYVSESESSVSVHLLAAPPVFFHDGDPSWTAESLLAGQCESEDKSHAARWRALAQTLTENLTELSAEAVGRREYEVTLAGKAESGAWISLTFSMVWT